jgi:hypothetical protein
LVAIERADNILSAIQEQLPMTSKLLVVSMVLSLSMPAFAGDAPAAGDHATESKDAKKKDAKKEEPKKPAEGEKKAEEKK